MNIEKTIKNLELRGFTVKYFENGDEAADYIVSSVSGKKVGIGGSMTVKELNLSEKLKQNGNEVFWHWEVPGKETLDNEVLSDVFLTSANAITEDGEILNIDGRGNRLAGQVYGIGKKTFIIAGTNKIEENFEKALFRAKNTAAVQNGKRFDNNIPCKIDNVCHDCRSKERICRALLVLYGPMMDMETEIILINGDYGY